MLAIAPALMHDCAGQQRVLPKSEERLTPEAGQSPPYLGDAFLAHPDFAVHGSLRNASYARVVQIIYTTVVD